MAEFQDELRAPGDHQRPVQTKSVGPDIFGAVADMWSGFNRANANAAQNAPSDAEVRAEKTAKGLDVFAAGSHAIMTGETEGPGANVLAYFGMDAKPLFEEMQRVEGAAESGEMSPTTREIQIERLVSSVMGAYPEASYEIMGQALGALGIDHAYARGFKALQAQRDRAIQDSIDAESIAYKAAAEAGITGSRTHMVGQGKRLLLNKHNLSMIKDYTDTQTQLADAKSKMTEAERLAMVEWQKTQGRTIVNSFVQSLASGFSPFLETLHSMNSVADGDAEMTQTMQDMFQRAELDLSGAKQYYYENYAALNADPELKGFIDNWFTDTEKTLQDLKGSNGKATDEVLRVLQNKVGIEATQISPVYQKLVKVLGQGMVMSLFQGTVHLPGLSTNELEGLQKEVAAGVIEGSLNAEQAREKLATYQATLNGSNLIREPDEAKRVALINSAAQISPVTAAAVIRTEGKDPQTLKQFNGAYMTLMSAILGDAETITLDNIKKVGPMVFGNKDFFHAMNLYGRSGLDPEGAVKMYQYHSVVGANVLDSLIGQYVNTGMVEWDQQYQMYKPITQSRGGSVDSPKMGHVMVGGGRAAPREAVEAANEMNRVLGAIESDSKLLEGLGEKPFVTQQMLKGNPDDPESKPMTFKDVFATEAGFLKAFSNFESFQEDSFVPQDERDKYFDLARQYLDPRNADGSMKGAAHMFDFSTVTANIAALDARMAGAEIRMNAGPVAAAGAPIEIKDEKGYKTFMASIESGGKFSGDMQHDPTKSTAAGTYGFTKGTWIEYVDKMIPDTKGLSDDEKRKLMRDPAIEDAVMDAYTRDNAAMLQEALGRPPTWDEVNVAHMLRYDTPKFLEELYANPYKKASDVFSKDVVAANGSMMDGTLLKFWNMRTKRKDEDFNNYMVGRYGEAPEMPVVDPFTKLGLSLEDLLVQ